MTAASSNPAGKPVSVELTGKRFGDRPVLGAIQFEIETGETLAILGPSGIGKTTLLRIIAGLDHKFEGTVRTPERIAMVFQEPVLLPWRTALDNILIATGATPKEALRHISEVGLAGREHDFPNRFSLGQQRRLSLARAFAAAPDLLVLDEPFASLDEQTAGHVIALTKQLIGASKVTTILVTHSLSEAARLAGRVVNLSDNPATLSG
jgi:ABC-type nitrate/sulfonate/bicarbonate transport system ATPase subunit